jgi:ribosome-binding protein aMBF1 (putative translation factor)
MARMARPVRGAGNWPDNADRYKPSQLGPTGHAVRNNVRLLRLQRGWSINELADRLDERGWPVCYRVLRRIEAGNRRVDVDELHLLAVIFGVDTADMLRPMSLPAAIATRRRSA